MSTWNLEKTKILIDLYDQETNNTEEVAEKMQISKSSVVNKLVKLGIYAKPIKPKPTTKKTLIRELNKLLNIEVWTLEKCNKSDLQALVTAIKDVV